jgi:antitoxin component of MazEF toxin-antitoxin module
VAVVIPKAMAREMNLVDGTALDISTSADSIVIRRRGRRPRRSIKEIVAGMKPLGTRRRRRELADGGPVGKELWWANARITQIVAISSHSTSSRQPVAKLTSDDPQLC